MKQILTRSQAVSIFEQVDSNSKEVDLFLPINESSHYLKMSNLEMENLLIKRNIISAKAIAAVVDY